jgi:hypothetical protein
VNLGQNFCLQWNDSLRELDVSWCSNLNDDALSTLTGSSDTSLMKLNLAGTGLATVGVK